MTSALADLTSGASGIVHVREARLDDVVAGMRLVYSVGLSGPSADHDILEIWRHLWQENPARSLREPPPPPLGWVMESGSRMVGYFANLPRRFHFRDRTLLVAVGTMWGVERPFRRETPALCDAYFSQRADMFLVTTSIKPTGLIFARYGGSPVPQLDFERAMYWVLDPQAFLKAALRKKGLPPAVAAPASYALAPALWVTGRKPGRLVAGLEPQAISLSQVGDEFDELWLRKIAERPRLCAYRTAADLRWQFSVYERLGRLQFLACRRGGRLEGYIVLVRDETPESGLTRTKIADLFVAGDDERVVDALLAAAYEVAAASGTTMLEAIGLPAGIRERVGAYHPLIQRYPYPPGHFRTDQPELRAALAADAAWYLLPYDGDGAVGWQGPYS